MKLKYYVNKTHYGTYNTSDKFVRIKKYIKFYTTLQQQCLEEEKAINSGVEVTIRNGLNGVISTQIGWRKWVMVLDCDTTENKDLAREELVRTNIVYRVFESSSNKYWIITNFISTKKKCIEKMRTIPGVDSQFVDFCENGKIVLRAFPKDGFRPHIMQEGDLRAHSGKTRSNNFLHDFNEWWGNSVVAWILEQQGKRIQRKKEAEQQKIEVEQLMIKATQAREEKKKTGRLLRIKNENE